MISWFYLSMPLILYILRIIYVYKLHPTYLLPSVFYTTLKYIAHISLLTIIPSILVITYIYYIEVGQLDEITLGWEFKLTRTWTNTELYQMAVSYCRENNYYILPTEQIKQIVFKSESLNQLVFNLDHLYKILYAAEKNAANHTTNLLDVLPIYVGKILDMLGEISPFLVSTKLVSGLLGVFFLGIFNIDYYHIQVSPFFIGGAYANLPWPSDPDRLRDLNIEIAQLIYLQLKVIYSMLYVNEGLCGLGSNLDSIYNLPFKLFYFVSNYDCPTDAYRENMPIDGCPHSDLPPPEVPKQRPQFKEKLKDLGYFDILYFMFVYDFVLPYLNELKRGPQG